MKCLEFFFARNIKSTEQNCMTGLEVLLLQYLISLNVQTPVTPLYSGVHLL